MTDLDLRPERRDRIAADLRAELEALVPGSVTALRGSLASRTADPYSDIDLCWIAEDESFAVAADAAADLAATIPAVRAVRIDPSLARSDRRRLVFVRLAAVPLFWRVDLDLRARSVAADDHYDDGNPAARDLTGWSPAASAIENAAAAIKSSVRGREETTTGLLSRGYDRIGLARPAGSTLTGLVVELADACARQEPDLTAMAEEIRQVAHALLNP